MNNPMTNLHQPEPRLVRMTDMYGCCKTILLMRGGYEIGRAVLDIAVRGRSDGMSAVWFIGPSDRPDADDFAVELPFKPEAHSSEDILGRVELLLKLSVSAADAMVEAA